MLYTDKRNNTWVHLCLFVCYKQFSFSNTKLGPLCGDLTFKFSWFCVFIYRCSSLFCFCFFFFARPWFYLLNCKKKGKKKNPQLPCGRHVYRVSCLNSILFDVNYLHQDQLHRFVKVSLCIDMFFVYNKNLLILLTYFQLYFSV